MAKGKTCELRGEAEPKPQFWEERSEETARVLLDRVDRFIEFTNDLARQVREEGG